MAKHKWLPFIKACAWAREQHLSSRQQWHTLCEQGAVPSDIPPNPNHAYRGEWVSWGDFLGTGRVFHGRKRHYRSFEEARTWARKQGLKTKTDWLKLAAEKKLPKDIPTNVWQFYRNEWQGTADFLGSHYVATFLREYRSFNLAREWAQAQGLNSETQWRKFSRQPAWLPTDIPANVPSIYKNDWVSWGDFLGTGYVATYKRRYRPFVEARLWARAQGVKSLTEWNKRVKEPGWLPSDIPADPAKKYGHVFTSGDFLGTGNVAPVNFRWMPFEEARAWARKQCLDSWNDWREFARSAKAANQWPKDIPTNASLAYKPEWQGWEDFLGVPRMAKRSKIEERLRHELASLMPEIDLGVRRIPIPGVGTKNVDICAPSLHLVIEFDGNFWHGTKESEKRDRTKTRVLQDAGWTVVRVRESPLDLLGPVDLKIPVKQSTFKRACAVLQHLSTLGYLRQDVVDQYEAGGLVVNEHGSSKAIRETWLSFAEAQAWVQAQGIKSQSQWLMRLKQEGWLPHNIPRYPLEVYKDQCATWGEFLGTGRRATFMRVYRTFDEARNWARARRLKSSTYWVALAKQEEWLPSDIPSNVRQVYKNEWTTWGDFLGTRNVSPRSHQWRTFARARDWARAQQVTSREAWHDLARDNLLPPDIPASPQAVYVKEWSGWPDFLGKKIKD